MKTVIIKNNNQVIFNNGLLTTNFVERFKGLMGKKIFENQALCIKPCNSIHMFFMRFPIDVIFIDNKGKVIFLIQEFKPWKISKIVKNAKYVIEMPAGSIKDKDIRINDIISINYK